MNSDSVPIDLLMDILSRVPAKSITRFYCVSKLWASILHRPYFTKLFLTRSCAQPRILFVIHDNNVWKIFSLPQRQSSEKSLVVATEFHRKFPPDNMQFYNYSGQKFQCCYASGLMYFYGMWVNNQDRYRVPVICNPNTGQYEILPYPLMFEEGSYSVLGFDPINKEFKVLFMAHRGSHDHNILTLGTEKMRWRTIKCPLLHEYWGEGICFNGVVYYIGYTKDLCWSYEDDHKMSDYVVVCFDVRSEKFKFVCLESKGKLINYKGKLCVIYWKDDHIIWKYGIEDAIELRVWILEDAEKQEWSKYSYTLWDEKFVVNGVYAFVKVVGVTTRGEILLSMSFYTSKQPFYNFYFNPERNTLQRVEIKGLGEYDHEIIYTFVDHVEDLIVNNLLNSNIYASHVKREEEKGEAEEEEEERRRRRRRRRTRN